MVVMQLNPQKMLKNWIKTGVPQKLNPEVNSTTAGSSSDTAAEVRHEELQSGLVDRLCTHGKLSYHELKQIKYVERDVITQIVDDGMTDGKRTIKPEQPTGDIHEIKIENHESVKSESETSDEKPIIKCEDWEVKPKVDTSSKVESDSLKLNHSESKPFSLENLLLCEECVAADLQQHLYELELEDDFRKIGHLQNNDPETGWWVIKDDFRNFKKIVRQGKSSHPPC